MTKDIEREAFKLEMMDDYNMREVDTPFGKDFAMGSTKQAFKAWQAAKAHEAKKLEGCVVVPVEPTKVMYEAYARHSVAPMSTLSKTGYKAMLEAARGGNE